MDKTEQRQQCNNILNELTGIDHLIIKLLISIFITFAAFLVILVIYKLAIEKKIVYKLSQYI